MWPYILYFLIGGTLVSAVAYVGNHADGRTAALVAGLPVLFIINMLLLYQHGGVSAGLSYARGALMYVPVFVGCVLVTMWLLPHVQMPVALAAGLSIYLVPVMARTFPLRADQPLVAAQVGVPVNPAQPVAVESVSRHEDTGF